jgi:hypothetical protein
MRAVKTLFSPEAIEKTIANAEVTLGGKEANAKAKVVVPVLELAGVDIAGCAHFEHNLRGSRLDIFVDHELCGRLLVETKAWGVRASAQERNQFWAYLSMSGADVAILTNGLTWELYAADSSQAEFVTLETGKLPELIDGLHRFLRKHLRQKSSASGARSLHDVLYETLDSADRSLAGHEENVRTKVVVPVLRLLGIDILMDTLFECDTDFGTLDLLVRKGGRQWFFIEVKSWRKDPSAEDRAKFDRDRQCAATKLGILTNGATWEFWPAQGDLATTVSLTRNGLPANLREIGDLLTSAEPSPHSPLADNATWQRLANRAKSPGHDWAEGFRRLPAVIPALKSLLERLKKQWPQLGHQLPATGDWTLRLKWHGNTFASLYARPDELRPRLRTKLPAALAKTGLAPGWPGHNALCSPTDVEAFGRKLGEACRLLAAKGGQ